MAVSCGYTNTHTKGLNDLGFMIGGYFDSLDITHMIFFNFKLQLQSDNIKDWQPTFWRVSKMTTYIGVWFNKDNTLSFILTDWMQICIKFIMQMSFSKFVFAIFNLKSRCTHIFLRLHIWKQTISVLDANFEWISSSC